MQGVSAEWDDNKKCGDNKKKSGDKGMNEPKIPEPTR